MRPFSKNLVASDWKLPRAHVSGASTFPFNSHLNRHHLRSLQTSVFFNMFEGQSSAKMSLTFPILGGEEQAHKAEKMWSSSSL